MSRLKALREHAHREPDPEARKRRLEELDKIEAEVRDTERRLAAACDLADLRCGRRPFFSWMEFALGLGVVGALVGSIYYGLPSWATIIVVAAVALGTAGVFVGRAKRRLKDVDRSA